MPGQNGWSRVPSFEQGIARIKLQATLASAVAVALDAAGIEDRFDVLAEDDLTAGWGWQRLHLLWGHFCLGGAGERQKEAGCHSVADAIHG